MQSNVNIENALRNVDQIEVPSSTYDKVNNVLRGLDQSENITYAKPRLRKPILTIAAAIMILVTLTTTALAATGVVDIASFFRSMFANEAVEPYIITGDNIAANADSNLENDATAYNDQAGTGIIAHVNESELEVELLAAFVDDTQGGGLYMKLEIRDPTGERISDSFVLILHDETMMYTYTQLNMYIPTDVRQWIDPDSPHAFSPDYVQIIDDYTAHAGIFIPQWSLFHRNETGEIVIGFDFIASNVQHTSVFDTGFNIGEHIGMDGLIALPGAEFVQIAGVQFDEDGYLIIYHHDTDADPLVYGWGSGMLSLMKPDGEIIGILGQRNNNVNPNVAETGFESRFDIGDINPNDLTLVWRGDMAEHIVPGRWEFSIYYGNIAIQEGVFYGYFEGFRTVADVHTSMVVLLMFVDDRDIARDIVFYENNSLVLYMADGTTVEAVAGFAEGWDEGVYIGFDIDPIRPADVVRMTFRGVEIGG